MCQRRKTSTSKVLISRGGARCSMGCRQTSKDEKGGVNAMAVGRNRNHSSSMVVSSCLPTFPFFPSSALHLEGELLSYQLPVPQIGQSVYVYSFLIPQTFSSG